MGSTFFFTMIAWVFFRSENVTDGLLYLERAVKNIQVPLIHYQEIIFIVIILFFEWIFRNNERELSKNIYGWHLSIILIWAIIFMGMHGMQTSFIYFQF